MIRLTLLTLALPLMLSTITPATQAAEEGSGTSYGPTYWCSAHANLVFEADPLHDDGSVFFVMREDENGVTTKTRMTPATWQKLTQSRDGLNFAFRGEEFWPDPQQVDEPSPNTPSRCY